MQDTWSPHPHEEGREALRARPPLEPVWLPTSAPWLNPIEKRGRWLRAAVLKVHRRAGPWEALRARVKAFLDQVAPGSPALLRYGGLLGDGQLAQAVRVS